MSGSRRCVPTDPSHGRGGQEWCSTHGRLLSRCNVEEAARVAAARRDVAEEDTRATLRAAGVDPELCPDWCAYRHHEHTAVRRRDPDEVARKLLDDAFFLRQHGENAPGYRDRTWRDWEMQVEVYLRTVAHFQANVPPEFIPAPPLPSFTTGLTAQERADIDACDEDD